MTLSTLLLLPLARPNDKSKKIGNCTNAQLANVLAHVDEGIPIWSVIRDDGIPPSTIRGHIYETTRTRRRGKKGLHKDGEEEALMKYLVKMQDNGFPLTMGQLRFKIVQLMPFKEKIVGAG